MIRTAPRRFAAGPGGRPLWLMTLADLGLLLIGFFVFLQANAHVDGRALASRLRAGFTAERPSEPDSPMPVDIARIGGFTAGSAAIGGDVRTVTAWARGAARDPRTAIRIAGTTDGSARDVDPATGSAAILAADRARAVAVALVSAGAVSPDRIVIADSGDRPTARAVTLTLGFAGDRHDVAGRQPNLAGQSGTALAEHGKTRPNGVGR